MRILVSDPISEKGVHILQVAGHEVDVNTGNDEAALCEIIKGYDALIVRSQSQITEAVIEASDNLKIIGRAGVGVDNISIPAATRRGIVVVNSPDGNTMAAAEHTLALMLSLSRNIPQADQSLRIDREWKRNKFTGVEVYGKTLGVIGLGKIGFEVAKRAIGFGMSVIAYDPFASADKAAKMGIKIASLETVLKEGDFITVHAPKTKDTLNLISTKQFAMMKEGVRIINCARGGIIDESALYSALMEGKIAGAALDVFVSEPPLENPLLDCDNIIATPHLGASTREAQINVAIDVAEQIVMYFKDGSVRAAVNLPGVDASVMEATTPYIGFATKLGKMLYGLAGSGITSLDIAYAGSINDLSTTAITRAMIAGVLSSAMPESVNIVNASMIAESRGMRITETRDSNDRGYDNLRDRVRRVRVDPDPVQRLE
ncbi:MAG: phosphoglycerate dehydrogenase, partial [bacterium]|nr:phosphoglycerate dehydrogenase [bacterium]